MQRVFLTSESVIVDQDDLIGVADASRLSGRGIAAIMNLLDRHVLPWYQLRSVADAIPNERVQRFTSRKAVLALPPKG